MKETPTRAFLLLSPHPHPTNSSANILGGKLSLFLLSLNNSVHREVIYHSRKAIRLLGADSCSQMQLRSRPLAKCKIWNKIILLYFSWQQKRLRASLTSKIPCNPKCVSWSTFINKSGHFPHFS